MLPPRLLVIAVVALVFLGMAASCAPRTWTRDVSPRSPLSTSAASAAPATPGRALVEEPPLPGDSSEGWPGLESAEVPAHAH